MVTVDKPDLKVCRMNVSKQEGEVSILHFHYLIGTKEGVRKAEEVHRLALVPTDQMVSYFKAAGLRCVFDEVGLLRSRVVHSPSIGSRPINALTEHWLSDRCRETGWLLKYSLVTDSQKLLRVRKLYKRCSPVA